MGPTNGENGKSKGIEAVERYCWGLITGNIAWERFRFLYVLSPMHFQEEKKNKN